MLATWKTTDQIDSVHQERALKHFGLVCIVHVSVTDASALMFHTVMPYNSAHHCVVEVENFLLLLGGEDQWNPNGTPISLAPSLPHTHTRFHDIKQTLQLLHWYTAANHPRWRFKPLEANAISGSTASSAWSGQTTLQSALLSNCQRKKITVITAELFVVWVLRVAFVQRQLSISSRRNKGWKK